MEDIVRDPLWTFVSAGIALLAIATTIALSLGQRKRKGLSYELVSNTQLLGIREEIRGKVKLLYEGSEVKNVHLLTVRFVNSGNEPIATADYERPVRLMVNEDATVLTHEIVDEDPSDLNAEATLAGNTFSITPLLLNPKDSFSIKALISDLDELPRIDGRVKGVKTISRFREGETFFLISTLVAFVLIGSGIVMNIKKETMPLSPLGIPWEAAGIAAIGLGYLLMLFAAIRNRRWRNMLRDILRLMVPHVAPNTGSGGDRQK